MPSPVLRRWALALVAALALVVPLVAGGAQAATDRSVSAGTLTWGVKQSFRSYVTSFIAQGSITPAKGATQAPDNGAFTFVRGSGAVRSDGSADLAFEGQVRFTGHHGQLDVTLADPSVSLDATGAGHLTVEHTVDGRTSTVAVGTVSGARVVTTGDRATLRGGQVVLSESGRAVFSMDGTADGSFYAAGDELDPLSADVDLASVAPEPEPEPTDPEPTDPEPTTPEPTTPEPTTAEPTSPSTTPTTPTPARSGRLTWGVKSSFRNYVGGPVAGGSVTTSGHASPAADGSYVFPQRSTTAKPPSPTGTTSYRGQVSFAGHHGDLDMSLRDPRVVVGPGGSAKLVVDSRPTGATGFTAVTVSTLDLSQGTRSTAGGSVTYSSVPVVLSSAGTRLFAWDGNAMYPAGTQMDPVSFTIGADSSTSGPGSPQTSTPRGSGSSSGTGTDAGSAPGTAGTGAGSAASTSAGAGSLTWGLRRSFRDYITGPIARGSISVAGGAGSSGGTFTFPQTGAATQDGGADYRGSVRFRGHGGILDVSLADPSVRLEQSGRGSLSAQVDGRRITVATLNLAGSARSTTDGTTAYTNVPATLTADGSSLFRYNGSSFYPAGTVMDPVSFTVGSAATSAASSSATARTVAAADDARSSATSSADAARARAGRSATSADACVATGSDLTWGFKESFRSYVSGTIASGDWSTKGGADYETPNFSWATGKGTFDDRTRTGSVEFPGTVAFSGHDGKLNTTISDPRVQLEGDRALIVLDVEGASMDAAMEGRDDTTTSRDVPFVEVDLSDARVRTTGGRTTITATDAPTSLTGEGEAVFSNYPAGTAFDPVSFTITADSSCLAPTKAATTAPETDEATNALAAPSSRDGSGGLPGWVPWLGGAGLGAAAAAAGAGLLVLRRRPEVAA